MKKYASTISLENNIVNYVRANSSVKRSNLINFIMQNYELSWTGARHRINVLHDEGKLVRLEKGIYSIPESLCDSIDVEYEDITERRLMTIPTRPHDLTDIEVNWIKSTYLTNISWWLRLSNGQQGTSNQHKELFDKWMPRPLEIVREFYQKVRFHYSHLCILMEKPVPDDFKSESITGSSSVTRERKNKNG